MGGFPDSPRAENTLVNRPTTTRRAPSYLLVVSRPALCDAGQQRQAGQWRVLLQRSAASGTATVRRGTRCRRSDQKARRKGRVGSPDAVLDVSLPSNGPSLVGLGPSPSQCPLPRCPFPRSPSSPFRTNSLGARRVSDGPVHVHLLCVCTRTRRQQARAN